MALTPGTKLGPYEVVAALGAGGMGEVYRARDMRLGREVAVKVLPEHLSARSEVRARFEREARAVSALNHPHICTLHDVGREGDIDFLVMELVEGETLAQRLARGALPAAETLRLGSQIADALDRAHRAGFVHRDLKPGNVMLTKAGAKLMDFGLARAVSEGGSRAASPDSVAAALSQSPTVSRPLTAEGTIVGTFQYMSPEQLEGRDADVRSDIWALGCVLYEMVTGRLAFEGRSQASLIAAILEREPAPIEPPSGSGSHARAAAPPPGIERLIRNCLAKDPDERIQTAHDVKLQLRGIAESVGLPGAGSVTATTTTSLAAADARTRRGGSALLAWCVAGIAILAAVGVHFWHARRDTPRGPVARFHIGSIPSGVATGWPRLSPDGRYIVVQASDSAGTSRAYVRPLDQLDTHLIPGTDGLRRAYWSPDSREIAFIADDKLQRVPIAGGSPVVICAATGGVDLSWGSKGLILMDGRFSDSLRVVPAGGGELRPATRIAREDGEVGCAWPCFLPDGEHFLYMGNPPASARGSIRLGKIGSLESKLLGHSDGRVEYAPGGWVLFVRERTLLAQQLDLGEGKLVGEPITVADAIRVGSSYGHFSVSQSGILAFAPETSGQAATLRESDRDGTNVGAALVSGELTSPRLSPDGHRLLYVRPRAVDRNGEIYSFDLDRGTDSRLTFTEDAARTPVWSPDGQRFAYAVGSGEKTRIRFGTTSGLGVRDSIAVPGGTGAVLSDWTPDGSRLVFHSDVFLSYTLSVEGADRVPHALVDTTQGVGFQRVSPDGRWLVYASGNMPNVHVFVSSMDGTPERWQISVLPGAWSVWTRGGREIIYEGFDGRLRAVEIDTKNGVRVGMPRELFSLSRRSTVDAMSWTCDAQGERFFLIVEETAHSDNPIEVVTDFHSLVSRK
jgi:Tol biopolymer transport system component